MSNESKQSENLAQTIYQAPVQASTIPPRTRPSIYPQAVQAILGTALQGREKRALGDFFGLTNFGVNLTRLAPQAISSLLHSHAKQDELIYILSGHPILQTEAGRVQLAPGMTAGFKAGSGQAHSLVNESDEDVLYLEIGDRTEGDEVIYPQADLQAHFQEGRWLFQHKDGSPY